MPATVNINRERLLFYYLRAATVLAEQGRFDGFANLVTGREIKQ